MIQRLIVLVALVAVLTAAACGLKGPPVPPDVAKDEEQRPSVVGEQKKMPTTNRRRRVSWSFTVRAGRRN
ncbi:MAG: hypothetical protein M5R36_23635 [Deltaproteobacteria bacterium]|nr:hypothetical protein [Deltaproteobacteria bacterium]